MSTVGDGARVYRNQLDRTSRRRRPRDRRDLFRGVLGDAFRGALGIGESGRPVLPRRALSLLTIASALLSSVTGLPADDDAMVRTILQATYLPVTALVAVVVVPAICADLRDHVPMLLAARPLGAGPTVLATLLGAWGAIGLVLGAATGLTLAAALMTGHDAAVTGEAVVDSVVGSMLLAGALLGLAASVACVLPRVAVAISEFGVLLAVLSVARGAVPQSWGPARDLLTPYGQVELILFGSDGEAPGMTFIAGALSALLVVTCGGAAVCVHRYRLSAAA